MHFIEEYQIDPEICDALIALHNKGRKMGVVQKGQLGTDEGIVVDKSKKDSHDLGLVTVPDEVLAEFRVPDYYVALKNCVDQYVETYSTLKMIGPYHIGESPIVQCYTPGGGYKMEHFERTGIETSTRMLVWMTYLNDVTEGGGTRFTYQDKTVDARKGKTLIWPTDFTHTHAGVVSKTQKKYIITGWLNFS
ncbi:hypothetical protein MNBD_GAMMA12-1375 [hydrothermal vent metagenome]|uniref:Prolyl 4-hydroxylase alpha subunit Fe(2+) 2OG dioxygenase domain-containing protein n=1 Tax=hydrothermal vent metagenome TaxID=652676 RepID=A0A3B0YAS9_9ZZZZ